MKHVLIISPQFPPTNAPDHQRVRLLLPLLARHGWRATVLAVRAEDVDAIIDPQLAETLPADTRVIRVGAWSTRWARRFGVGSLGYRAWGSVLRAGEDLLHREKIDLVLFSTAQFRFLSLGPRWKNQFGVPYILDIQDPWWSDYYRLHPHLRPPGGRLKYALANCLAARQEPPAVRAAAHVVCVSAAYPEMFRRRYPELTEDHFSVLPFGAPESDFEALEKMPARQNYFDSGDGREHWVYVGRCGQEMGFAVRAFLLALKQYLTVNPTRADRLRVHFLGTDYAPRSLARKTAEPIARELGLEKVFDEQTDRLPYFDAMRCLRDASALILPGSDDPGYSASKVYSCILARKPTLAVFHEASGVAEVLRSTRSGTVVTFNEQRSVADVAADIQREWFARWPLATPATDWQAFEPYTGRVMVDKLCDLFDRAIVAKK